MNRSTPLALVLCIALLGCGGSKNPKYETVGEAKTQDLYINLKADGGRTRALGMIFNDEPEVMETRVRVAGDADSRVFEINPYYGGATLHLRGYDLPGNLLWTKDVPTVSNDTSAEMTVDPNGLAVGP